MLNRTVLHSRGVLAAAMLSAAIITPANPLAAIYMAPTTEEQIQKLTEKREEFLAKSDAIVASLDDGVDMTDEQVEEINANSAEIAKIDARIEALKSTLPKGTGTRAAREPAEPGEPGAGRRTVPASPRANDPRGGFRSFGEFAVAVRSGSIQGNQPDQRLLAAATTYGNEGTGADGGFAVPQEFRRSIWQKVLAEENLLTRCDRLETGSNNMTVPKDETTPWQTSGGVLAYWEGEAQQATQSKPQLEMSTIRLAKLMALVPVSEELLEDAPGLESWLRSKAPAKMVAKLNTGIVDGTGVGQPLGILRSPSLITVSKHVSQPADSIWFSNISDMWSRLYAPLRRNAIWLINQDVEPQLDRLAFDPQADSKVPVYLPAGGLSASPYATLKGRPVVPMEACKTIGDKGDIILTDLSQYMALTKAGQDIRTDVSMHLYFDQAVQAFRFIFRVNGQPWWGSAISPQNGNLTRSWAVTLEAR